MTFLCETGRPLQHGKEGNEISQARIPSVRIRVGVKVRVRVRVGFVLWVEPHKRT